MTTQRRMGIVVYSVEVIIPTPPEHRKSTLEFFCNVIGFELMHDSENYSIIQYPAQPDLKIHFGSAEPGDRQPEVRLRISNLEELVARISRLAPHCIHPNNAKFPHIHSRPWYVCVGVLKILRVSG